MQSRLYQGCLYLEGAVTVQTVTAALYRQFTQQCVQANTLDLSGVVQADSACLSLLLAARRIQTARPPTLTGLPAAVRALADLYDLCEWIPAWTPDTPAPLSFSHSV